MIMIIIIGVVAVLCIIRLLSSRMHNIALLMGKTPLVIKKFSVEPTASLQVQIVARKAGLFSWFGAKSGMDSDFILNIYPDRIESKECNASGVIWQIVPVSAISTFSCGSTRPVVCIILATIFFCVGVCLLFVAIVAAMVFFILGIIFFISYFLRKALFLCFTASSRESVVLVVRRSVIEGVSFDEKATKLIREIVQENLIMLNFPESTID